MPELFKPLRELLRTRPENKKPTEPTPKPRVKPPTKLEQTMTNLASMLEQSNMYEDAEFVRALELVAVAFAHVGVHVLMNLEPKYKQTMPHIAPYEPQLGVPPYIESARYNLASTQRGGALTALRDGVTGELFNSVATLFYVLTPEQKQRLAPALVQTYKYFLYQIRGRTYQDVNEQHQEIVQAVNARRQSSETELQTTRTERTLRELKRLERGLRSDELDRQTVHMWRHFGLTM